MTNVDRNFTQRQPTDAADKAPERIIRITSDALITDALQRYNKRVQAMEPIIARFPRTNS
jgi:hypothetical protein